MKSEVKGTATSKRLGNTALNIRKIKAPVYIYIFRARHEDDLCEHVETYKQCSYPHTKKSKHDVYPLLYVVIHEQQLIIYITHSTMGFYNKMKKQGCFSIESRQHSSVSTVTRLWGWYTRKSGLVTNRGRNSSLL
jgi:hypothetical protein